MTGVLNIYKERGFTSHDVVAVTRRLYGVKAGHTGTLDPEAEGVLPVCLGHATRLADYIGDGQKEYEAVVVFGRATDTQDATGAVVREAAVTAGVSEARAAVRSFLGDYYQTPPMYSALKVGGRKLYELARKGADVPRERRLVRIERIEADLSDYPRTAAIAVVCSKGTYVRTLCHDLGERLGGAAHMGSLVRTRVGAFTAASAVKLSALRADGADLADFVMPVEAALPNWARLTVSDGGLARLKNGNPIPSALADGTDALADGAFAFIYGGGGRLAGVYRYDAARAQMRPTAVFPGESS